MARSKTLIRLCVLVGVLGLVSAAAGLLWRGTGEPLSVTTLRGQSVELYGRGLYQNDTVFFAGNNFATDLVTALLAVPLLLTSLRMHIRGSIRGRLLLLGSLGYFLYYGFSYAFGVAYNEMFLVYVALLSASMFAFVLAFASFDLDTVRSSFAEPMPRRLTGVFMIASGIVTLAIWLMEPVSSLLSGDVPKRLETQTTLITHSFDMAIIVPAAIIAGVMVLRRELFGYVVACSLLVLEALLLPIIAIATSVQVALGVSFEPGEAVAPIGGFGVFSLLSVWVLVSVLRQVREAPLGASSVDVAGQPTTQA